MRRVHRRPGGSAVAPEDGSVTVSVSNRDDSFTKLSEGRRRAMARTLILVKHAKPGLDAAAPARAWRLGDEGERQARAMAGTLQAYRPFVLVCSDEPKAHRTAEIIGAETGAAVRVVSGLRELDRPVLPIVDARERERLNRPVFEQPSRAVLGEESADEALARFAAAIDEELAGIDAGVNLVAITHGTVMALFAAAHSVVDPWKLWRKLECGDLIAFELPGFQLSGAASSGEIAALYETHADDWDRHRPRALFEGAWLERFRSLLPDRGVVLDLGCGAGEPIAAFFVDGGYRVHGVDTSPSLITKCAARFPEQRWQLADMRVLALDGTFDGIIAWDSFFHLARDDQRAMFEIFARHTNDGAALMFTSGTRDGEVTGALEGEPLYHASLSEREYRRRLAEHGFRVVAFVAEDPDCGGRTVWLAVRGTS